MQVGLLGRKVGMTQIFEAERDGGPDHRRRMRPLHRSLQVRTMERDGYHAVQLGFDDKKRKSATQAERGHAKKADAEPKRYVREIRQETAVENVAEAPDPGRQRLRRRSSRSTSPGPARAAASRASSSGTGSRGSGRRTV